MLIKAALLKKWRKYSFMLLYTRYLAYIPATQKKTYIQTTEKCFGLFQSFFPN